MTEPYYEDELVTLYHGDCLEVDAWLTADVLVTDPPYPNSSGHFDDAVETARNVLPKWNSEAVVFWSEVEFPPLTPPMVAVHIWHRTNVNGKPYEPAFHFAVDGIKRRSIVVQHAAINLGATGSDQVGSHVWASGHPTQKPVGVMERLISATKIPGLITDPFAGSGSTLIAARNLGRKAIGVEVEERYCELIAKRLDQMCLDFGEGA